jgi:hypothetical protein
MTIRPVGNRVWILQPGLHGCRVLEQGRGHIEGDAFQAFQAQCDLGVDVTGDVAGRRQLLLGQHVLHVAVQDAGDEE